MRLSVEESQEDLLVWPDLELIDVSDSVSVSYLASDLVTVYSNHKMLGIRLVSRTRKYSDIGLSNEKRRPLGETSLRCLFWPRTTLSSPVTQERGKQRKERTTYHAAILGNNGVSTSCVKKNQTMPIVLPASPP